MKMINSYPTIYALGHKALADLFKDDVVVQEKVDGSQFSFGVFPVEYEKVGVKDELCFRSREKEIHIDTPHTFKQGVEAVLAIKDKLTPNVVYRGEYLAKNKQSTLLYDRIPDGYVMLFDIEVAPGHYLTPDELAHDAEYLGFGCVPTIYAGRVENIDMFKALLETESVLGGNKIEGVIVKNYHRLGVDKKPLMGKYVSEAFREKHSKVWKNQNAAGQDILAELTVIYRHENRWAKAVQHLRDAGELENSPQDIGKLFREVSEDIRKECEEEIKERLFQWAWKRKLSRSLVAGLAEWYKAQLLEMQFQEDMEAEVNALIAEGRAAQEAMSTDE